MAQIELAAGIADRKPRISEWEKLIHCSAIAAGGLYYLMSGRNLPTLVLIAIIIATSIFFRTGAGDYPHRKNYGRLPFLWTVYLIFALSPVDFSIQDFPGPAGFRRVGGMTVDPDDFRDGRAIAGGCIYNPLAPTVIWAR